MKLVATREFSYATRRLLPGDTFEASDRDGKLLIAVKKAQKGRPDADVPTPRPGLIAKAAAAVATTVKTESDPQPAAAVDPAGDELTALRAQYEAVIGKKPFNGWDADKLRQKIAAVDKS